MNNKENKKSNKRNSWIQGLSLTSLGWELALPIFIGTFLGYQLDRRIGTNYLFTITLLFVGIASGYYNLIKYIKMDRLRNKLADLENNKELNKDEQR